MEQESTTDEPTVRPMQPDEVDEVFALIQTAFGQTWPRIPIAVPPLEHLKWKQTPPLAKEGDMRVLVVQGRIIGYRGAASRDVWVRGRTLPGRSGGDYSIHPDFQDRGFSSVFRDLSRAADASAQRPVDISEHSTHPSLRRSVSRQRERVTVANKVDRLTLPLQLRSILPWRRGRGLSVRSVLRSTRALFQVGVNRVRWRRYSTPPSALTLSTVEEFDDRADTLWGRSGDAFEYAVVRDRQYLNWRYCDPRAGIYRVRGAERDGELLGYAVTALNDGDSQLVDILTVPGDEGVLRALIEDALAFVRAEEASWLTVLMPSSHPYRETFLRYGFVGRRASPIGFRRRTDGLLDFLVEDPAAKLHVAFGDSDAI